MEINVYKMREAQKIYRSFINMVFFEKNVRSLIERLLVLEKVHLLNFRVSPLTRILVALLSALPYLNAVDDVLPQNVAAGTHRRQRVQVGRGYPDGERRVLLAQALTSVNRGTEIMADEAAGTKLHDAEQKTHQRDDAEQPHRCVGMDNVADGGAADDEKGGRPGIVGQVLDAHDPTVKTGCEVLDGPGESHGGDEHCRHLI